MGGALEVGERVSPARLYSRHRRPASPSGQQFVARYRIGISRAPFAVVLGLTLLARHRYPKPSMWTGLSGALGFVVIVLIPEVKLDGLHFHALRAATSACSETPPSRPSTPSSGDSSAIAAGVCRVNAFFPRLGPDAMR